MSIPHPNRPATLGGLRHLGAAERLQASNMNGMITLPVVISQGLDAGRTNALCAIASVLQ
jgi:hypothetical protein